ncbi:MAG: rhodanese-like domain-containing protein [Thermoanaerobaculia bacterium]
MKRMMTFAAAALLAISGTLASGCSKSESAASASSPQPAAAASAPVAAPPATPEPELQPTPGLPVATFTPKSDMPAPMLPTLDSVPASVDEHGHPTSSDAAPRINVEEAAMLVQSGDAIILDVRTASAFAAGHIKGAVNIPYDQVASRARAELSPTRWIIPYCT